MKTRLQFAHTALICLAFALPSLAGDTATVLQVLDGDTCQLDDGRHVRYLGIDAPETGDAGAEAATQANNTLVGGKKIRLELGKPDHDRDGRLLAYVFVGKACVNEELLRQGVAYVRRPVGAKYKTAFVKAQEEARQAGHGMWAGNTNNQLAIATVHAKPERGGADELNDEYIVIENRGEKPVDLTGWTVSDEAHHRYLFPKFTLPAAGKVTLHTGLGQNTDVELFWGSRGATWNDDGDTIFIRDPKGKLVLAHLY